MTVLDAPPMVTAPQTYHRPDASRSPAAWRFATRLAWRETRRRPGRTVLASLLIAVPVLAMTVGSVLVRTDHDDWATQFARDYGDVDVVVNASSFGMTIDTAIPASDATPPAGTTVDDYLWTYTTLTTAEPTESGRLLWGVISDIELAGDGTGQPIEVTRGRAPAVGEILLDSGTADRLGVSIGDEVELDRPSGSWTLAGIGRLRSYYEQSLFVLPGFDPGRIAPDAVQVTTTFRLPDGTTDAEAREFAARVGGVTALDDPYQGYDQVGSAIAWGWVGGVLALVAVGIVVAAAFATSGRRQLVTIGQLSSNGATQGLVRRTLALQGTWTGLIGSIAGLAVGLAMLPLVRPWAQIVLGRELPAYVIGWSDLVIIAITAVVAGTIAAAVPAKSAARIPVMAAIAGRRPLGRLPRWLVPTGAMLVAGGIGLMALSTLAARNSQTSDWNVYALLIVIGVVGVVFGMCCATPFVIERVGTLGRRAPLSWRLALRGLQRSRARSSAVVAAIAVAVAGSIAAAAVVETTLAEDRASWLPMLPADTVVLQRWDDGVPVDATIDPPQLPDVQVPADLLAGVESVAPVAVSDPLRFAVTDPPGYDPVTGEYWPSMGPLIADEAVIRALGLHPDDAATLERVGSLRARPPDGQYGGWYAYGPVVGVSEGVPVEAGSAAVPPAVFRDESGDISVPAPLSDHRFAFDNWSYGTVLITEQTALELGFDVAERGVIVQFDDALTPAQRQELLDVQQEQYAGYADAFVEPGDPPRTAAPTDGSDQWGVAYDDPTWREQRLDDIWIVRGIIVAAALLVSLLVVAVGLSLAAADGRDERDILTVVGATPASMRRQAAARAAVMALVGIALGIPTGFLPAWVLYRVANAGDWYGETLGFPWLVVGTLVVVVPALVAVVAWIGSGVGQRFRPPSPTRRD